MMDTVCCSRNTGNYSGNSICYHSHWADMILTGFETLLSFPKAGVKPYSPGPQLISVYVW
jgi:hypothetical protein